MNNETLVKVDNVSRKFCRDLKKSLWYGVKDVAGELTGRNNHNNNLRRKEFWAVNNISFELRRGECLGLIGPNGAGKTTLLKMLNGLIKPDIGKITVNGRVGALIALGAGFNPILTGRENIYVNGAVLGLTKREIDKKLDEIIAFAEIGDFIDAPVQTYSSGMQVRLGFAIAVQMEPDVLFIDEVLAVGDVGFRGKCYNAIYDMNKDAAVIFVSHTMQHISRLCTRVLVLNHGKVKVHSNNITKAIEEYINLFGFEESKVIECGESKIRNIMLLASKNGDYHELKFGDDLKIQFDAYIEEKYKSIEVNLSIISHDLQLIAQCNSKYNNIYIENNYPQKHFFIRIPKLNLSPGNYYISITMRCANTNLILSWHHLELKLKIVSGFTGDAPIQYFGEWEIERKNSSSFLIG